MLVTLFNPFVSLTPLNNPRRKALSAVPIENGGPERQLFHLFLTGRASSPEGRGGGGVRFSKASLCPQLGLTQRTMPDEEGLG